jgi:hypothetical protein
MGRKEGLRQNADENAGPGHGSGRCGGDAVSRVVLTMIKCIGVVIATD